MGSPYCLSSESTDSYGSGESQTLPPMAYKRKYEPGHELKRGQFYGEIRYKKTGKYSIYRVP